MRTRNRAAMGAARVRRTAKAPSGAAAHKPASERRKAAARRKNEAAFVRSIRHANAACQPPHSPYTTGWQALATAAVAPLSTLTPARTL